MFGSVWNWLASLYGDDSETSQDGGSDTEQDDSRFVRSELDRSVMWGHGGGRDEGERELQRMQEQTEQFDQHDH